MHEASRTMGIYGARFMFCTVYINKSVGGCVVVGVNSTESFKRVSIKSSKSSGPARSSF